jgi:hypothetical protein
MTFAGTTGHGMRAKGTGSIVRHRGKWCAFSPQDKAGRKVTVATGCDFRHQAERALNLWLLERMVSDGR